MKNMIARGVMTSGLMIACAVASGLAAAKDSEQIKTGAAVYEKWCLPCHAVGDHYAGTVALRTKYNGAIPAVLTERTDLSPEFIKHFVRNGYSIMPTFRQTEVSDKELEALTAYVLQKQKK